MIGRRFQRTSMITMGLLSLTTTGFNAIRAADLPPKYSAQGGIPDCTLIPQMSVRDQIKFLKANPECGRTVAIEATSLAPDRDHSTAEPTNSTEPPVVTVPPEPTEPPLSTTTSTAEPPL